ncbi:MAG: metallophosphoesterase [Armatimonadetes bacterium]|nr:metallophosphoesterase [Armatimonadota bacterium]
MRSSGYLAVLSLTLLAPHAVSQEHLRFVVTGDDRGDDTGVNTVAMKRWIKAVLQEKPSILLFNGDLVAGAGSDEAELAQFKTWLNVMQPIYKAGIKVLTCRGNHETLCPHPDKVWRQVFSGRYANPSPQAKGEEQETYAYTAGNVLFLALDQFHGQQPEVNQKWLDQQLAANPKLHVFPFTHKMAFRVGLHDDGMDIHPAARDRFLDSILNAGGHVLFFGHDHLYDHTYISKPGKGIHQIVVGTAGAPFYNGADHGGQNGDWKLNTVSHIERKIGYCVVDVDGAKVTVTFKAETSPGVFKAADKFSWVATPRRKK